MPKGMGYSTGGKHAPGGDYGHGGTGIDVTTAGAGSGNHQGPNTKDDAKPGGMSSSGSKSDSKGG